MEDTLWDFARAASLHSVVRRARPPSLTQPMLSPKCCSSSPSAHRASANCFRNSWEPSPLNALRLPLISSQACSTNRERLLNKASTCTSSVGRHAHSAGGKPFKDLITAPFTSLDTLARSAILVVADLSQPQTVLSHCKFWLDVLRAAI